MNDDEEIIEEKEGKSGAMGHTHISLNEDDDKLKDIRPRPNDPNKEIKKKIKGIRAKMKKQQTIIFQEIHNPFDEERQDTIEFQPNIRIFKYIISDDKRRQGYAIDYHREFFDLGETKVVIRPITDEEYAKLKIILKDHELLQRREFVQENIHVIQDPFNYEDALKELLTIANCKELVNFWATEGLNKDPRLIKALLPKVILLTNNINLGSKIMNYQDHTLLFLNAGTGKTQTCANLGFRIISGTSDKMTPKFLFGGVDYE